MSNGDKDEEEKSQNIDNGEKRMKNHEEEKQKIHNVVDTVSTYQKIKSPEKHGELPIINKEQNNDMNNVMISRDSMNMDYNSPEKHGVDHNSIE